MKSILAISLVAALAGCSFFLKGVPGDWTPESEPDCQPFIIVPLVDGALGLAITGWALGSPCQDGVFGCAFGLAGGAAMIGAGIWGYLKVKSCNEANAAHRHAASTAIAVPRGPAPARKPVSSR
jgi:hypothetical protein